MILVVDVGNTNIVLGVYKGSENIVGWRISTDAKNYSGRKPRKARSTGKSRTAS